MKHVDLLAKTTLTTTGVQTAVAIGSITGAWTLVVEVYGLDTGGGARIAIEDSVDNSTFGRGGITFEVGPVGANGPKDPAGDSAGKSTGYWPNPVRFTARQQDFPTFLCGTTGAYARLNLSVLVPGDITLQAWIESNQ